jgi:hypothetical protein
MKAKRVVDAVQQCLSPELLTPAYRRQRERVPEAQRPYYGHCAVASEAVYFMLGGKKGDWTPHTMRVEGGTHWFLKNKRSGEIVDPTAGQFACELEYGQGRGRGFPTPKRGQPEPPPSRRAQTVIACATRRLRSR